MNNKTLFGGITIFSLVLVGGSYFFLNTSSKPQPNILSYTSVDKDKPIAEVKETFKDLGKIKVSEQKEAEFILKNKGVRPLQLSQITSSCGCTVGQIAYKGKTSQEYGMHSQSDDVIEIAPQTEATITVIYRPYVMPVYGLVEREVYITTNDPNNPKLTFKVKSIVN